MAYEMKPNSGSMFENDKAGNESRPDYKGKARVGDKAVWVSAWWGESRNGPYLSLRFEEMTEEQIAQYLPEAASSSAPTRRPGPPRGVTPTTTSNFQQRREEAMARVRERQRSFQSDIPHDDNIPF